MWHEARKQEKKIRGLMVDFKKRAERRREFYEKTKLDPTQFLRVYGRPYKINLDPAIAMAAESPQSMMPWQGNRDNMIDRFDVRAHLDFIPEYDPKKETPMKVNDDEERHLNYERYRTLVENEAAGLTEEQALQQIYIDEQFGPPDRTAEEEKKKLAGKKAAIGYTYEDSTPAVDEEDEDEDTDESSDTDIEAADLDITLNVDELTPDQIVAVNQCAEIYGMKNDDFVRLLMKDKEELEALRQAKIIEEEKAQFAGRKSRRERRAFKEKRLAGRKISPPSYAARDSPKYEPYKKESSSSCSRSPSPTPANIGKKLFITSFGKESDNEELRMVHGPSLPSESGPQSEHSRSKRCSWSPRSRKHSSSSRSAGRDRPPSPSSSRYRRDWRARGAARSRSRSRSRSRGYGWRDRRDCSQYSRSRSPRWRSNYDRRNQYRRYSRSRSRSRSFHRRSRSRSGSKASSRSSLKSLSRSRSNSSQSSSYSSSSSRSKSSRSRSKSRSPSNIVGQVTIKRYRRPSATSDSSKSDSDMETNGNHNESKSSPVKRSTKPLSLPGNLAQSNKVKQVNAPGTTETQNAGTAQQTTQTRQKG
ncbi:CLK4-associating serine/arginine rich protein-like isoform X2 [Gigantopelta aegis]|uniref:CLK4-associating serine/arginine rich protein-like isoform X2 n=1 Tax=Gigantopelta aegis TaxID=1735272 RepID=UPI001B88C664|nr:CLK4-associating serine/arginine rich protein-like isoform X2 [Gigantopelta aegis]